ncbi:MAG: hypothetical protein LUE09_01760, partial [Synergistaceae bacterium]|nr:hypothetical protein [Synergistaceae bacterium]
LSPPLALLRFKRDNHIKNRVWPVCAVRFCSAAAEQAAAKSRPPRRRAEGFSFSEAKKMLDLSCSVLPLEAAKRVISLLYFEALICKENRLASAL